MKRFLFLLIAFFSLQVVVAQESNEQPNDSIYEFKDVEVKPDFKGGPEAFYKFIAKNFRSPEQEGVNGKIITTFIIEKDGTIDDIEVLQDVGFGSGDEIIKVLSNCPKWIPAKINNIPVRVRFQLPITIKPDDKFSKKKLNK